MVVINNLEEKGPGFYTTYLTIYHVDNPVRQFIINMFIHVAFLVKTKGGNTFLV